MTCVFCNVISWTIIYNLFLSFFLIFLLIGCRTLFSVAVFSLFFVHPRDCKIVDQITLFDHNYLQQFHSVSEITFCRKRVDLLRERKLCRIYLCWNSIQFICAPARNARLERPSSNTHTCSWRFRCGCGESIKHLGRGQTRATTLYVILRATVIRSAPRLIRDFSARAPFLGGGTRQPAAKGRGLSIGRRAELWGRPIAWRFCSRLDNWDFRR